MVQNCNLSLQQNPGRLSLKNFNFDLTIPSGGNIIRLTPQLFPLSFLYTVIIKHLQGRPGDLHVVSLRGKDKKKKRDKRIFQIQQRTDFLFFLFFFSPLMSCSTGVTQREYFHPQKPATLPVLPRRRCRALSLGLHVRSSSLPSPSPPLPAPPPRVINIPPPLPPAA